MTRPRVECPLCGLSQLRATIDAHVGSDRCQTRFGAMVDGGMKPTAGQHRVLAALDELRKAMAAAAEERRTRKT